LTTLTASQRQYASRKRRLGTEKLRALWRNEKRAQRGMKKLTSTQRTLAKIGRKLEHRLAKR